LLSAALVLATAAAASAQLQPKADISCPLTRGPDPYTDEPLRGLYVLHSWQNDVTPPRLRFLTRRVSAGRPVLAALVTDRGAGVDPLSLVVGYRQSLLLAALSDPSSGLVVWLLDGAPRIRKGKTALAVIASDYQESKNVDQAGENILPNTAFRRLRLRGVAGPTVTWLLPRSVAWVGKSAFLAVAGSSSRGVRSVAFFAGQRRISKQKGRRIGLYSTRWTTRKAGRGRHVLRAVVTDRHGLRAHALRVGRVCRP